MFDEVLTSVSEARLHSHRLPPPSCSRIEAVYASARQGEFAQKRRSIESFSPPRSSGASAFFAPRRAANETRRAFGAARRGKDGARAIARRGSLLAAQRRTFRAYGSAPGGTWFNQTGRPKSQADFWGRSAAEFAAGKSWASATRTPPIPRTIPSRPRT